MWKNNIDTGRKEIMDIYANSVLFTTFEDWVKGLDEGTLLKKEVILRQIDTFRNFYNALR